MPESPENAMGHQEREKRIVELVRTLRDAEAELQELNAGEIDAVLGGREGVYLLREAQERLRRSEGEQRRSAARQTAILNALPANIALVDAEGVILAVNESWRRFAQNNGLSDAKAGVGWNYLRLCDATEGEGSSWARKAASGIRSILSGESRSYSQEYPCHSPDRERWYKLTVSPLQEELSGGAVVMHTDITARKLGERERQQLVYDLGERVKELRALHRLAEFFDDDRAGAGDVIQNALERLPEALQFPDRAAARIAIGGRQWTSPGFRRTEWRIEEDFSVREGEGTLELVYLEEPPSDPPFLPEERDLLQSFAEMLRAWLERRDATKRLLASETRLRTIIESEPESVTLISRDGTMSDVNPAGLRIIEAENLAQVAGRRFTDWVHPGDRDAFCALHERACRGESGQLEFRLIGLKGTERWMEIHSAPLHGGGREIASVLSVTRDITERKRAESDLAAARQRMEMVLTSVGEGIHGLDLQGRITFENPAGIAMLGWSESELIGRDSHSLIHHRRPDGSEYPVAECPIYRTLRDGVTRRVDDEMFFRKDGSGFPVEYVCSPVRDTEGVITGAVISFRDVTERRRMEQGLKAFAMLGRRLGGAVDEEDAARIIVETADELFHWDSCALRLYDVKENLCRTIVAIDTIEGVRKGVPVRHPKGVSPSPATLEIIESGARLILRHGSEETPEELLRFGDVNRSSRSLMIVPVRYKDEVVAIFSLHSYKQNAYGEQDLATLEALADHCGGALARVHALEAFRESQRGLSTLISNLPGMVYRFRNDRNRTAEFVSEGSVGLTGHSPADLTGNAKVSFGSLIHPDDRESAWDTIQVAIQENRTFELTYRINTADGLEKWIWERGQAIALSGSDTLTLEGFVTDITSQRRAEEDLRISGERFRLLTKATNDAIWDWNLETDELWWNEGFEELFGFKRSEIESTIESWYRRIHPDDKEAVSRDIREAIDSGREHWMKEYRFLRSDGSSAYVLDRGYVIRNVENQPVRMIGGMTDLTDRHRYEERISEQAALLDAASDAIFVTDRDENIIYWNKGAERTYGWSADEAVGQKPADLFAIDTVRLEEARATLMEKGEWRGEIENRACDGQILVIEASWTLLRDHGSVPKAVLAIHSDITERKIMTQQLLRAQRMESIGTLAGGISHDLNNVLSPILMAVEFLQENVSDDEGRAMLATVRSSAERGAELVRQVLGFARGVEGKHLPVRLDELARDLRTLIRETFPKNVDLELYVPAEVWTVVGDATQLHQVLMNLCVNARDAMPEGGSLTIRVRNAVLDEIYSGMNPDSEPGPYVIIEVNDTGCGIPRDVLDRIFDPFFTTKEIGKGTGLGLSTVGTIVKSHGGFINVYSERGKGTQFKVYLPATTSGEAAETVAVEQTQLPRGRGELILVVDDEEAVRNVTRKTLERFGFRVLLAEHGAEAVGIYAQRRAEISAVLTDMAMPVLDGPGTIVALQAIDPDVKIIGCSGLPANSDYSKAMGAGVKHFIPKPYSAETVLRTLSAVLSE